MMFRRPNRRRATGSERRLDRRKSSTIQAAMRWEHDIIRQCRITSLSLSGMLLELKDIDIQIGAPLEIFFYSCIDDSKKLCSERVQVVGKREKGIAVSFARFDNQHQSNIQLMLQQTGPQPRMMIPTNHKQQDFPGIENIPKTA